MLQEVSTLKDKYRIPSDFDAKNCDFKYISIIPSRKTFIRFTTCGICERDFSVEDQNNIKQMHVENGDGLGDIICHCANPVCLLSAKVSKAVAEANFKTLQLPQDLRHQLYTIKRSNGELQNNWSIEYVHLHKVGLCFGMRIRADPAQDITKLVPAKDLIEYNHELLKQNLHNLSELLKDCFCDFYPLKQYEIFMDALNGFDQQLKN